MSNLYKILKITFINKLGLNAVIGKNLSLEDKKKSTKSLAMMVFIAVTLIFVVCVYANLLAMGLEQLNMLYMLPFAGALVSSLLVFVTSIYKASGILFSSNDYDFLMSLPISNRTILASKVIELLTFSYGMTSLVMIPTTIIYFIRSETSIICFLYMVIGIIFLPLIPIVLSSILGFLISFISSKFKFSKLATIVVTTVMIVGIFVASSKSNEIILYLYKNADSLANMVEKIYPPSAWFAEGLINNDIVSLLKFLAISIIPFIIFVLLFSNQFKKIISRLGESYEKADYKMKSLKTSSVFISLIKIEFKKLFSSPSYLMNTVLVPIILVVLSIVSIFTSGEEILGLFPKEINGVIVVGLPALFSFMLGVGSTTLSTISFEGHNFWILKTLPVDIKKIFLAKAMINIILNVPCIIISTIVLMVAINLSIVETLIIILVSVLFNIFISLLGVLINLKYPKFDWIQEIQAVKNTMSVTVGLFTALAVIGVFAAAYYILKPANPVVFLSVVAIGLVALIFGVWNLLSTKGVELFKSL